ncbi:MAG: hypothetical protein AB7J35_09505 [Dehalococcoidia bacterium]
MTYRFPSLAAALVSIAMIAVVLSVRPGSMASAQSPNTTIFIEGLSIQAGASGTTSILVRTDASTTITSFSLVVAYDQSLVRPDSVQLDNAWDPTPLGSATPDTVQLAGTSADGCLPGNSCRLAQVTWLGIATGSGSLRIVEATLNHGADDVTFSVTEGALTVAATIEPTRTEPAPTAPAAQHAPPPSEDGLGRGVGFGLVVLVALAGAALGAPIVWLVFRLKRMSRSPGRPAPASELDASDLAEDLTDAVANYLSAYESGAQAGVEADLIYDQMARQAAGFNRPVTPDRLAVDE